MPVIVGRLGVPRIRRNSDAAKIWGCDIANNSRDSGRMSVSIECLQAPISSALWNSVGPQSCHQWKVENCELMLS